MTLAPKTTSSRPASPESATMPVVNASRSPRNANWRGMKPSRAMNEDSRGKSANAVFAASARTRTVASWMRTKKMPSPTSSCAICARTVCSSLGSGTTPRVLAMKLMPRNRVAKMAAAHTSVIRALRHSGGLNAGTPSEIASTPVRAAAPELNARRTRKMLSTSTAALGMQPLCGWRVVGERTGRQPRQADADHAEDEDDVQVRRRHEDRPGLADPAQVAEHEDDDDRDAR